MKTFNRKSISFATVFIISCLFTMTSFSPSQKINSKNASSSRENWCPVAWTFTSTVTLDFGAIEDNQTGIDYTNTNFTTWSGSSYALLGEATFTVELPSNNPAGTLILTRYGVEITRRTVPANTNQVFLLSDPGTLCGGQYAVTFN